MLSKLLVASALILSSQIASAGGSNAMINCESASGRTTLSAWVPGDYDESMVNIAIDGKRQDYLNQLMIESEKMNGQDPTEKYPNFKKAEITTHLIDKSILVYAAEVGSGKFDDNFFTFKSVGKLKSVKSENSGTRYKFKAVLENVVDPRKTDGSTVKQIGLNCVYDYSI